MTIVDSIHNNKKNNKIMFQKNMTIVDSIHNNKKNNKIIK